MWDPCRPLSLARARRWGVPLEVEGFAVHAGHQGQWPLPVEVDRVRQWAPGGRSRRQKHRPTSPTRLHFWRSMLQLAAEPHQTSVQSTLPGHPGNK